MLVSFLVFWAAEAAARAIVFGERRRALWLPAMALAGSLAYGAGSAYVVSSSIGPGQDVVIVQGNAPLNVARDPGIAWLNLARLHDLTRGTPRPGALVVWPEGALPVYVPAGARSAADEPAFPWYGDGSTMLVGAFASDALGHRYNAAFLVDADGRVDRPYFKRVLIPFGESIPFSDVVPWLGRLNERAGVFTAGSESRVFDARMPGTGAVARALRVAPLICYEDTVPTLSREAVLGGANLLVNLTYDTWFGRTVAPDQHHLIAAFRAVENGRYLVRATNSGFSGVVDPLGRTVASVPPFTPGTATARVRLLSIATPYTRFIGDRPWWLLLGLALAGIASRRARAMAARATPHANRRGGSTPHPA
jgi:apolipoprotein N-acyltransferase